MKENSRYFFCGIGGNGMSPLARLLAARGVQVIGSDRAYDQGRNLTFFEQLAREGIKLVPQDGSGVDRSIDSFVVTRAVEETIPDIRRAKDLELPIIKRPQLMAELFRSTRNIAVGGTGGKSTTTGMIGYILKQAGVDPLIVDGAVMLNYNSNFAIGQSDVAVFEADESDGLGDVIGLCSSDIAVLTNISLDHFEVDELRQIFGHFVRKARLGAVLNADCPNSMLLGKLHSNIVTFGLRGPADVTPARAKIELDLPGEHNLANALAAVAACQLFGLPAERAAGLLHGFKGIQRRLQLVGEAHGVRVIDDFASNPAKISAALGALLGASKRLIAVFQPHGFQPTKMMRRGYVDVFSTMLRPDDILVMPEIYYVGGTVNYVDGKEVPLPRDISSQHLTEEINGRRGNAHYFERRQDVIPFVAGKAREGDVVVVMGSRDETLPEFAAQLYEAVVRR